MSFPVSSRTNIEVPLRSSNGTPTRGHLFARVKAELSARGATDFHQTADTLSFEVPWDLRAILNPLAAANSGRVSIEEKSDRVAVTSELRFLRNAIVSAGVAVLVGFLVGASDTPFTGFLAGAALWFLGFGVMYAHAAIGLPQVLASALTPLTASRDGSLDASSTAPHN